MTELLNPQPRLFDPQSDDSPPPLPSATQDALRDELFSLVRRINDPEHPHTLEELGVVSKSHIWFRTRRQSQQQQEDDLLDNGNGSSTSSEYNQQADNEVGSDDEEDEIVIELTPTVPHCSLATTIGLCVRYKVESSIPTIKLAVHIRDGTHRTATESQNSTRTEQPRALSHSGPQLRHRLLKLISSDRWTHRVLSLSDCLLYTLDGLCCGCCSYQAVE